MFDNVKALNFGGSGSTKNIAQVRVTALIPFFFKSINSYQGMTSGEGETITFRQSVQCEGRVEEWMTEVLTCAFFVIFLTNFKRY